MRHNRNAHTLYNRWLNLHRFSEKEKKTTHTISPAVEGLDPEKIDIEVNLVSKEAEIFVE